MAIDPFTASDNLLNFLQLPPLQLIEKFIEEHTNKKRGSEGIGNYTVENTLNLANKDEKVKSNYGTSRENSSLRAYLWRGKLKKHTIKNIQKECAKPMKTLGYGII